MKQLPPTAFFVSEPPEDDDEAEREDHELVPLVAGTKNFESILDALGSLLRFRMFLWHYRSHDERLIAFSNAHIYSHMLTTFPGLGGSHVLRYVPVPWEPGAESNSAKPEVNRVVDLIFEHAHERPDESLGVIAMGIKHANRIEECLRRRLSDDPRSPTNSPSSSMRAAKNGSSSRTSRAYKVTSATRSSSRSATGRMPAATSRTAPVRCSTKVASDVSMLQSLARRTASRSFARSLASRHGPGAV
jgi:hypothetical protein